MGGFLIDKNIGHSTSQRLPCPPANSGLRLWWQSCLFFLSIYLLDIDVFMFFCIVKDGEPTSRMTDLLKGIAEYFVSR